MAGKLNMFLINLYNIKVLQKYIHAIDAIDWVLQDFWHMKIICFQNLLLEMFYNLFLWIFNPSSPDASNSLLCRWVMTGIFWINVLSHIEINNKIFAIGSIKLWIINEELMITWLKIISKYKQVMLLAFNIFPFV